jgi:hypothetical protein
MEGKTVPFEELLGKTITEWQGWLDAEEVLLKCSDGSEYRLYHEQSCCEHVWLEEASGCDTEDIVGSPILLAEEIAGESGEDDSGDSYTWTFYKLSTIKGSLTLRWLGESNGYYSERVTFERTRGLK